MIKLIYSLFHKLSIRAKLLLSFLAICLTCFTTVFFIAIPQLSKNAEANLLYSAEQALEQAKQYITYQMKVLQESCYSIAYDTAFLDIISKDAAHYPLSEQNNDHSYLATYKRNILTSHKETLSDLHYYLNDEFVYASADSTIAAPYSIIETENWYQTMLDKQAAFYFIPPSWNLTPKMISAVHLVSHPDDYSSYIGAVVLDIPQDDIISVLRKCAVTTNARAYLVSDDNVLVSASTNEAMETDPNIFKNMLGQNRTFKTNECLYFVCTLDSCNWTLIQAIPTRDINVIRSNSLQSLAFICTLLLIVSVLFSAKISIGITRRIQMLSTSMQTFHHKKAEPIQAEINGDEIDYLLSSYNQLLKQLDQLTIENIKKGQKLNETELALLHSQIKPHFLFNTLDMIRHLADTNNLANTSKAVKALSSFYRAGLGNHTIWSTIEIEIKHIQSYMEIQQLRYGDNVKLDIEIPPEMMDINLPRITLQPIVENALIHGIQHRKKHSGNITISAKAFSPDELHLSVKDNGCGMSQEMLITLFESGRFGHGIGLWNTNERIRMHYGTDYGLSVQSVQDEYTEIIIRIPILRGKEKTDDNITRG